VGGLCYGVFFTWCMACFADNCVPFRRYRRLHLFSPTLYRPFPCTDQPSLGPDPQGAPILSPDSIFIKTHSICSFVITPDTMKTFPHFPPTGAIPITSSTHPPPPTPPPTTRSPPRLTGSHNLRPKDFDFYLGNTLESAVYLKLFVFWSFGLFFLLSCCYEPFSCFFLLSLVKLFQPFIS